MGLREYWKKRDFKKTPEPRGRSLPASQQLQFVVQQHDASRLHYDFRLELDGTLKSWAIPKGPSLDPAHKRLAVHVEDHPLDYGEFEGTIPPKQYGAGTVLLWDRGTWAPIGDPRSSYRRGRLQFSLHGTKLQGMWNLVRMGRPLKTGKEHWLLIKEKDEQARSGHDSDVTQMLTDSVLSGRTIDQIASGRHRVWQSHRSSAAGTQAGTSPRVDTRQLPAGARKAVLEQRMIPQLATLVERPPEGDEWIHEMKYDGYRILCRVNGGSATLFTRNGNDWTSKLRKIAQDLSGLPVKNAWLDGEVVALLPDGRISFQSLQNAFDARSETSLVYYVFDLLHLDGYDLRPVPLVERKRMLAALLNRRGSADLVRYSDHIAGQGDVAFKEACRSGMEGLIAKRTDAAYLAGRNRHWVKIKCGQRQEFVIGGFTEPSGSRVAFGALLLGVYEKQGHLRYAGRTGTGFSERSLQELHKRLRSLEQRRSPFVNPPGGADVRRVHWVKPVLVAEVAFAEWTNEGLLRQAAFQGLREDKDARSIIHERPDDRMSVRTAEDAGQKKLQPRRPHPVHTARGSGHVKSNGSAVIAGVTLSHPDRVLFPDPNITKKALAQYYHTVGKWILPHVKGRPLTLVRCPGGYTQECFYQKHASDTIPEAITRVEIPGKKGPESYMVANSLAALVGLVQMGVLELHTWGARQDRPDRPDRIILDLDPDPSVPWKSVVEGAQLLHSLLHELGLLSFVKTTGGKGLHVVVPLQRVHTWDEVKFFAKAVADHLVRMIPDRFIASMSKQKRTGKIFVDYLRNTRGATAVAAYSTRAKPGAPVSVPLSWGELSVDLRSDHFTMTNLPERLRRLRQDPWRDYFSTQQKITSQMKSSMG